MVNSIALLAASDWAVVGAFWATVAAAFAAIGATIINYYMMRNQLDPHVIVYVKHDHHRPSLMLIVIENIGAGMARDIRFHLSQPIPAPTFSPPEERMKSGPLFTGIPALAPGESRIINWSTFNQLYEVLGDEVIDVTVFYSRDSHAIDSTPRLESTYPLELASFAFTDASGSDSLKRIADQMKVIGDTLSKSTKTSPIKVEVASCSPQQDR